jgi:branched-chain amino acid transport system permease protein
MSRHGKLYWSGAAIVVALAIFAIATVKNEYFFFASYIVLQFVVLATAWNILGGYAGYVNFGTGAFFGACVYTSGRFLR